VNQHVILCGLGRVGGRVLEYLRAAGAEVAVINDHPPAQETATDATAFIQGDCRRPEVWEKAGLNRARGVLILTSDDLVNVSTALMVRQLHPKVRIIVRMFNEGLISRLGKSVENVSALSTSALAAPLLALIARTGKALGTFELGDGRRQQISELTVCPGSNLAGESIAAVCARASVRPVAHITAAGARHFARAIDPQTPLAIRDRLVVCGEPDQIALLQARAGNEKAQELRWAPFLRRQARVVLKTFAEIDMPVKVCTSVLFAVIIFSVLVFHLGMEKDTLVDSFYRTVSLMATGADMGGREMEPGGWQKAFASALRLLGLGLVAAFTAIITNYLVRAHLGGALEARRIPESGHIIVCGLGNVGFRVVQELLRQEERVVVIERDRTNPFISAARGLGAAVLTGSATVTEVLKQARADQARAVVAATSNDLVNLETALLVRDLNPHMRLVLRVTDPNLARTLREAANIHLTFSIPELAAPAFVAVLFGERIRSIARVEDRLVAVVDLIIQEGDSLLELASLRELATRFDFIPLSLRRAAAVANGEIHDMCPQPGDHVTGIMSLGDLQRLLQRDGVRPGMEDPAVRKSIAVGDGSAATA
jgi:Trk K+ transport system NAD-binding subunit